MIIKTITSVDGVNTVDFGNSASRFYWFLNIGNTTVYVSASPNIVPDADGVIELAAGRAECIETLGGKVYVLGAGKVRIHNTGSKFCPFRNAPVGGGGGESVVTLTRAEYDALDVKDADTYYIITDDVGEYTDPIVLNVGTGKEFTSFTAAMQAAAQIAGQKVIINVFAGEYDIYSELGGDDYIASIGDSGWTVIQPVLNGDVEIKGIGNVVLKLEIPSDIYSQYPNQCNRVSAINNSKSISVENITFQCQNCRYAIHDECGNDVNGANTKHIFRNCRFYHTNTLHVIGIGTVTGYFEIVNCYSKNTNGCLFLHDWSNSTGGNLIVSNCIFDSETNNEMLLSVNSNHDAVFDVYLSNNNFEKLGITSVDIDTCNTNIFRIIGVNNTISSVEIVDGLTNPYPVKLV